MRRVTAIVSVIALVLLGTVGLGLSSSVVAQDATPASNEMMEEGIAFVPIGFAEGVTLPSPADLIAVRVTIEPDAVSPFLEDDPTGGLLIVESGTFTVRVDGPWSVSRAAAVQQMMGGTGEEEPDIMEAIAVGEETTLSAGDTAFIPGSVAGEIRNAGQEPAVGLIVLATPGGTLAGQGAPAGTPAS
jgi:quercetin dioxygenase-like cupin family protein